MVGGCCCGRCWWWLLLSFLFLLVVLDVVVVVVVFICCCALAVSASSHANRCTLAATTQRSYTNHTFSGGKPFTGTLDYIFLSPHFNVTSVLEIPTLTSDTVRECVSVSGCFDECVSDCERLGLMSTVGGALALLNHNSLND